MADDQNRDRNETAVGNLAEDEKRTPNPAQPLPTTNDEPSETVETDALIEDRFEATDN